MKKVYRTKKIVISTVVTAILVTGGALTYGFQGVLASLGLLSLIAIAVFGLITAKKARLYSRALKFAEAENTVEENPITINDEKWIIKNLDELLQTKVEKESVSAEPVNAGDRKWIMTHIDELFTDWQEEGNVITSNDKKLIMENVDALFYSEWEQDRQFFT